MPLPPPLPETVCRPLRRNLARCSAIIGVVALLLPPLFGLIRWFLPGMPGERVIQFSLTFVLVLTGLICGAIALSGLGRHGPKGILAPGLTGLLLNLLLGGFFAAGMLAARREEAARTKLLSATQPLRQTIQEMKTSVSNGTPVKPPEFDLRDLGKNLKDASRMLSGDNRLITEANANLVSRLRPITTSYDTALAALEKAEILLPDSIFDRSTLQSRRQAVTNFIAVAERYKQFQADTAKLLRAEMASKGITPEAVESAMSGLGPAWEQKNQIIVQMRECDLKMGRAMLGLVDLQDAAWGRWKYNKTDDTLDFERDEDLKKYVEFRRLIDEAAVEQPALQKKVINLMR